MGSNIQLQDLMSRDGAFKAYVKSNEGYNPKIYNDTKKIPTTGYGFNIQAEHVKRLIPKDVLSRKRALSQKESDGIFEKVYSQSVSDAERFVTPKVFNSLPPEAQQVLIDMSYNMGSTKLNKFEKMKKALIAGDMRSARKELLDSDYARKDVPDRAKRNADLLYKEEENPIVSLIENLITRK